MPWSHLNLGPSPDQGMGATPNQAVWYTTTTTCIVVLRAIVACSSHAMHNTLLRARLNKKPAEPSANCANHDIIQRSVGSHTVNQEHPSSDMHVNLMQIAAGNLACHRTRTSSLVRRDGPWHAFSTQSCRQRKLYSYEVRSTEYSIRTRRNLVPAVMLHPPRLRGCMLILDTTSRLNQLAAGSRSAVCYSVATNKLLFRGCVSS